MPPPPPEPAPDTGAAAAAPEAFLAAVLDAPENRGEVTARWDDVGWPRRLWDAACLLAVGLAAGDPAVRAPGGARSWLAAHPQAGNSGLGALHWPSGAFEALARAVGRAAGLPGLEAIAALHAAREPGIARRPSLRLVRRDLEAVVPEGGARTDQGVERVERLPTGRFFLTAGHGRKRAGVWYTPPALARRLVEEALAPLLRETRAADALLTLRIVDPAMGSGAILEAALAVLAEALAGLRPGSSAAEARRDLVCAGVLQGVDRDPVAVEAAAWRLTRLAGLPRPPEVLARGLRVADALAEPSPVGTACFDAVLGNPPWEVVHPKAKEFFAAHDPGILDAPTRRERAAREAALLEDPAIAAAWDGYRAEHAALAERVRRAFPRSREGGAGVDLWQLFAERAHALARPGGVVGLLLPSAFHANRGAVGLRRLYLLESDPVCCLSFENRGRLFDIDSRFKFAVVATRKGAPGEGRFRAGFYLRHPEDPAPLAYDRALVEAAGGVHLTLPEPRTAADLAVLTRLLQGTVPFGRLRERLGIQPGRELDMTQDAARFVPTATALPDGADPRDPEVAAALARRGLVPLHEGKTLHQWEDRWGARPRYLAPAAEKPGWEGARAWPRLAWRAVASATNARTAIFAVLPPGVACGNSAIVERRPRADTRGAALAVAALANGHVFDWALRVRNGANVNLFILDACPVPATLPESLWRFLVHGALRLSCTHAGHAPLWRAVVGEAWREAGPPGAWPAVSGPDREGLALALDAAAAHAYGLDPAASSQVLQGFRHPETTPPERILAALEALQAAPEAFLRRHDPYAELPVPGVGWEGAAAGAEAA